jgi:hypothetical protein
MTATKQQQPRMHNIQKEKKNAETSQQNEVSLSAV